MSGLEMTKTIMIQQFQDTELDFTEINGVRILIFGQK